MEDKNALLIWDSLTEVVKRADNVAYITFKGETYAKGHLLRDAKITARKALELKEFLLLTNYQINKLNKIIEYGENS